MRDHGGRAGPARPPRRCWRPWLAVLVGVLALALGVAACGGGGKPSGVASLGGADKATATTRAGGGDDRQAVLNYARCMRQHGIDLPDPTFDANGRVTQGLTSGPGHKRPSDPTFKAAQQACQHYLPNGGQPPTVSPQRQQRLVQFARCVRQHGIDMPDPGASGGIDMRGVDSDTPKFKAAVQACRQLAEPAKGGK
jgi:hypothetical protein